MTDPAELPELSQEQKLRLVMSARIAAGMCANPHAYVSPGWQAQIAHDAYQIVGKLILLARTGGC